jgi:hypothetical protein
MRLAVVLGVVLALAGEAAAADEPVWMVDGEGRRFRVRFDPGHRVYLGTSLLGRDGGWSRPDAAVEMAVALRAPPPPAGAPVFWKRDHVLAHLRLRPGGDGVWMQGTLYRGTFLRHSREGSLTIPTTPPLRLALPFDVGVRIEVGGVDGTVPLPSSLGATLDARVIRGEAMADFLRSEHPGRWLAVGLVGYYDVALERGVPRRNHRVAPLTGVAASARGESGRGLAVAELRAQWARTWSSRTRWGNEWAIDAELELTPIAVNDLPLSIVVAAHLDLRPQTSTRFLALAGLRLGIPLPLGTPPGAGTVP